MKGAVGLQLSAVIEGNLWELTADEVRAGERSVSISVRSAAQTLKADWRSQIAGAGLGAKLTRAVQVKDYPQGQLSLNASSIVYSKAPKITGAHDSGSVIRSAHGFWLAIPLSDAGHRPHGRTITPAEWEKKNGRRLKFVYRGGNRALLVDDGTKAFGNVMVKRRVRGGTKLSEPRTFKNRTVPIFALVPQVQLRKRIDLYPTAERIAATIPGAIVANWRS